MESGNPDIDCSALVNDPRQAAGDIGLTGGQNILKCLDYLDKLYPDKNINKHYRAIQGLFIGIGSGNLTDPQTPSDPNEKDGPGGVGAQGYITGKSALPYTIYFENKDTAALPAQDVTVTDQLDSSKVDLSTFRFGVISFGNNRFIPPAGQNSFTTNIDLRPAKNLIVKVTGSLNPVTGIVSWKFNSLDPPPCKRHSIRLQDSYRRIRPHPKDRQASPSP